MTVTPALITAIIALIGAITSLVKSVTDNIKIKNDRAATAEARDNDSRELHDKVLKLEFTTDALKHTQTLTTTTIEDLREQVSTLNVSIVKLNMSVEQLCDAFKAQRKADQG